MKPPLEELIEKHKGYYIHRAYRLHKATGQPQDLMLSDMYLASIKIYEEWDPEKRPFISYLDKFIYLRMVDLWRKEKPQGIDRLLERTNLEDWDPPPYQDPVIENRCLSMEGLKQFFTERDYEIVLRYHSGEPLKPLAKDLGLPHRIVRSTISRAHRRLRSIGENRLRKAMEG